MEPIIFGVTKPKPYTKAAALYHFLKDCEWHSVEACIAHVHEVTERKATRRYYGQVLLRRYRVVTERNDMVRMELSSKIPF